jgi:hypothetical protein
MSVDIVKYAFIAGEISPTLLGRTDLTKYDLAVAEGLNFFVDYRGGLSSRPGTQFIDTTHLGNLHTRMFKFAFAPNIANSYIVFFGHNYIRFYQDGGLVLDGATPYEITTPFTADDLDGLVVEQYRDLLRITSASFPTYNLVRHDHTNWELAIEDTSPFVPGITITGTSVSAAGSASVIFAVTKVLTDGTESAIGPPKRISGLVNYTAEEGAVSIKWAANPDAVYYNVYRSVVATTEVLSSGSALGFVGRTHGTKFTDPNIVPDFTHVPPTHNNPFAPGAIEKIVITAGGAGYNDFVAAVSITDPTGSGFVGQAVVNDAGEVTNVIIKYGGEGYTAPVVVFSGGGAGAVAVATTRPLTGTYPALSAVFQQRQLYGASENDPITIWGSRIKQFSNFAASDFVLDDDAFEFVLDSAAIAPIRHFIITRGGLLAMTQNDVWLVNGGGNNAPLTPTNALADPQSYNGVSSLRPIKIENDLLFAEGKGHAIRMLAYNEVYKAYNSEDRSILSSHLFGPGRDITHWGYQQSPYKIVWCVREDGALLAFTSIKSEEVFAWTPCQTKGKVTDLIVLQEGIEDRVYITVERKISGAWVKFLERLDLRQYINIEDAWCVDCGLSLTPFNPSGSVTIFHDTDTDVWTAVTSDVQTSVEVGVGDFLRGANGIFKITSGSGQNFVLEMYAEPTNFIPENGNTETFSIPQGEWTCDTPVSTLGGLDHLEGEEVSILADGNVFTRQTVVGGAITLDHPVTRAIVGLSFTCRAKTLPMIVANAAIEAKRKRVVGIGIRMDKSRGIRYGPALDQMSSLRERTDEAYGHSTRMVNGMKYQLAYSDWNEEGQTYFEQTDPLPVNILSIVSDIEVGDEPD